MFSKACEYGIRATLYIALQSEEKNRVSLKEIAKQIDSPEAFTAKILQKLVKNNIIKSIQGAKGGFEVELYRTEEIKLEEIVLAIDGDDCYNLCVLGLKACSATNPCPVHHKYKDIKSDLRHMLETTSLAEMLVGLKDGETCLTF
jgi:Rrf2 family transcriptional regulator, iron-sulfur cluster assembly transcription factor